MPEVIRPAQIDDHWYIAGGPDGQTSGPEAWILQDPHSAWMANSASPDSVWIAGRAASQGTPATLKRSAAIVSAASGKLAAAAAAA